MQKIEAINQKLAESNETTERAQLKNGKMYFENKLKRAHLFYFFKTMMDKQVHFVAKIAAVVQNILFSEAATAIIFATFPTLPFSASILIFSTISYLCLPVFADFANLISGKFFR